MGLLPTACKRTMRGHKGPVYAARFSSDGNYCMSCGRDRTIRLWNPHKGSPEASHTQSSRPHSDDALLVNTYDGVHGYEVTDLCIAMDNGKFASCGGDKCAFVWDVASGRVVQRLGGHTERLNAVAFNPEASVLITGCYDRMLRLWDLRAPPREPLQALRGFGDSVTSIALPSLASGNACDEIVTGCVDGVVRTYDLRRGLVLADDFAAPVTCVSLSRDRKCILAGCLPGSASVVSSAGASLQLVEKSSGARLAAYQGHKHEHYALGSCLTRDDAHVVSGSEDGRALLWELVAQRVVATLRGHSAAVCCVAGHPKNAATVLTASHDGTCKLWARHDD